MLRTRLWVLLLVYLSVSASTSLAAIDDDDRSEGFVYTLDNATAGNHVLAFHRAADGTLLPLGAFATGGTGTGVGLGSQGALALTRGGRWLIAVNAGSNELSVFRTAPSGLSLTNRVNSGGQQPISVTIAGDLVYALNAGGNVGGQDNVAGFVLTKQGALIPLPGSMRHLSAASTGPAQIQFADEGEFLIVTEKNTNAIDLFTVGDAGTVESHQILPSVGQTPFGFAVGRSDEVLVSEANGGAANAGTLTAYALSEMGKVHVVSAMVPDDQTAPCWVVITAGGRFAFTSNTGSDSVSSYSIACTDGQVSLLSSQAALTGTGSAPIDMALSRGSSFLYVLNGGNGTVGIFQVRHDGHLETGPVVSGIPAGAAGIVAR